MATEPAELPREGRPPRSGAAQRRAAASHRQTRPRPGSSAQLGDNVLNAQSLGWLSIGLGLTALLAPRATGELTGLRKRTASLRLVGLRELVSGIGLLNASSKAPWLWARVAGDVMDLALIASALTPRGAQRARVLTTAGVVAAIAAADVYAGTRESSASGRLDAQQYVESTVIVNKSPQECYQFWRDLSNLPKFSALVESVAPIDERRSHWTIKGPMRSVTEWDSEITVDKPGERIAWRSVDGAPVEQAGVVRFDEATGGRGTLVRISMHYGAPAGGAVRSIAKLFGLDPGSELRQDLRRFKQLIETGEIATTRGQPSGRRSALGRVLPEGRKSREGRLL